MKYNLLCFQISDRLIIFLNKHDYQVLTSLMKENKRYKRLKTAKWISIRKLVPGLLLTVRSAGASVSLSFTIYLEIVLLIKSTNQKHGGFDVTVSLFSWDHPLTTAHA